MRPIIDHRFWILFATCFASTQCIPSYNHHTESAGLHSPPSTSSSISQTTPASEWPPAVDAAARPHPNPQQQKADEHPTLFDRIHHPAAAAEASPNRDLNNMHQPSSDTTATTTTAAAHDSPPYSTILIKNSAHSAIGISSDDDDDHEVISTNSSGTNTKAYADIRHAPLPRRVDEDPVVAAGPPTNATANVSIRMAASSEQRRHTSTSLFGPASSKENDVEYETRKPSSSHYGAPQTTSLRGGDGDKEFHLLRHNGGAGGVAAALIRHRRRASSSSDPTRFGATTQPQQLGHASSSEMRHRHPQQQQQPSQPQSDAPIVAQLDRPITHQVKPPTSSDQPLQLTPSRYAQQSNPRAQIPPPQPHEQQYWQQKTSTERDTSNTTSTQQLLKPGDDDAANAAASQVSRDNDGNIDDGASSTLNRSETTHTLPPQFYATATTTTPTGVVSSIRHSISTDHNNNNNNNKYDEDEADVVVVLDSSSSLNDDDVDVDVDTADDDDADMELNAIQRGAHSNEQIIILSNGDSSARSAENQVFGSAVAAVSAEASAMLSSSPSRQMRHFTSMATSSSTGGGGMRLVAGNHAKPTMRRRSAAPAPPISQPKSVATRRVPQPPPVPASDVLRNPLALLSLSSSSSAASASAAASSTVLDEPKALPLRPIIRGPYDDEDVDDHQGEMTIVYAEPHTEIKLNCDVDLDIMSTVWLKDGQLVHTTDRNSRPTDNRFIRELRGGLTITNAMLEDDGKWQCEAENARGYVENARPVKLVVLDRPKPPYLLIDSRRLDAGNIFVPVKENSELSLACISEGGNPKPTLTWEVLLSPGVDRHTQKGAAETLDLQEVRSEKDKESVAVKSEAKLSAVYRAHHNARILCVMEHPTLKMRQNASILLDVQYTPSFAISRTPGFGYPLREGIEVSLKCDVDSNPPSTPMWQKDDGDPPVPQTGDGFLNFTAIRREHSGWYKCTSRHLNFQYSSIGYYLSIRYDTVDVTSEPLEQDISVAASHTPNKRPQLEVQLGGAVTLQCPQGSLGCWSHLDPVTAKLRGLGMGLTTPTGQFSLKDVVYQDAGIYKCIGQSTTNNKKKVEVIHTVAVQVKGAPTVSAKNNTPVAYPGAPLHLSVEFCANPPAFAARWLHGDRVYTPGNQYGIDVLAYGVIDLPTPFCKEARLTYVHMHERVPRTFYFVVSSPGGVAETIFNVNFTLKHKVMSNSVDDDDEELSEPEEIHFPVFGSGSPSTHPVPHIITALPRKLLASTFAFIARATSPTALATIAKGNDRTGSATAPPPSPSAPPTASAISLQLLLLILSPVLLLMNSVSCVRNVL